MLFWFPLLRSFLLRFYLLLFSMNDLVYPVNGGMEDWAYAGSWDTARVKPCQPVTYDKYPADKTIYDNSTLRVFNMLVETSNDKEPATSTLGTSWDIMTTSEKGNGHVARNIRLALLAAELVEPYVAFRQVNDMALSDDVIPLMFRGGKTCQTTNAVVVPKQGTTKVAVKFEVGGALTVDKTAVYYAKWDAQLEALLDCQAQPDMATLMPHLKRADASGATTGTTRFSAKGATPSLFTASIDITDFAIGDRIAVLAVARVDQAWGVPLTNVIPNAPPQSHIVNARTNPQWYHAKSDGSKVIKGRLDWVSIPLTLILESAKENSAYPEATTHELFLRYDPSVVPPSPAGAASSPTENSDMSVAAEATNWTVIFLSITGAGVVLAVVVRVYVNHAMRKSQRERLREFIEDESAVSPGLQQILTAEKNGTTPKGKMGGGYSDAASSDAEHGGLELGTCA
jgi:hypothetical protein